MDNYYKIANVVLKIRHADDELSRYLDSELRHYRATEQKAPDCSLTLNPAPAAIDVPKKAVRLSIFGNDRSIYSHGQKVFLIDHARSYVLDIDHEKRQMAADYAKSNIEFQKMVRWLLKWLVIKSAEAKGMAFIHASAAKFKGKIIVFSGDSNCGKSSFLLRLVKEGARVISDDTVLFDGTDIAPFSLNTAVDGDFERRFSVKSSSFDISEFVDHDAKCKKADLILFLKIWNSDKSEIRPLEYRQALLKLINMYKKEIPVLWPTTEKDSTSKLIFEKYASFLENTKCYEFYAGYDEKEVRNTLLDFLK